MRVVIVILAVALGCHAISDEEVLREWNSFQTNHGKTYKSPLESRKRLAIFRANLEKIDVHNALYEQGLETYQLGVTPFTDWTSEEFSSYVNKYQMEPLIADSTFEVNSTLTAPDSIDWRSKGAVREVKNQGSCGSCWSFSATGAMEGQATLRKGLSISLSEQNLIDCADETYGNHGCSGGVVTGGFTYVRYNGIDTESNYPYTQSQGTCKQKNVAFKISSFVRVGQTEASLKEAVGTVGPVSVAIEATNNLQNYRSGIIYDTSCTGKLNHGVLVVGYGSENGMDYWIVKNSWGASWGEAGFFRLIRNKNNCGIAKSASYPNA